MPEAPLPGWLGPGPAHTETISLMIGGSDSADAQVPLGEGVMPECNTEAAECQGTGPGK